MRRNALKRLKNKIIQHTVISDSPRMTVFFRHQTKVFPIIGGNFEASETAIIGTNKALVNCACRTLASLVGTEKGEFPIMLNIRDLKIENASLGRKMLLVEVVPAYEYKDKQRTDTITGYRYVVCLVDHHLEKLNVRIDGAQLMAQPDGFVEVEFEGLEVRGYESQGKVQFTAKATGIFAV